MSAVANQGQGLKPLTHARILAIALPIMQRFANARGTESTIADDLPLAAE